MLDEYGGEDGKPGIYQAIERPEEVVVVPLSDRVKTGIIELIEFLSAPYEVQVIAALSILEDRCQLQSILAKVEKGLVEYAQTVSRRPR